MNSAISSPENARTIVNESPLHSHAGQPLIRRAAVLGAGTMGSRIAAHLANAGIPVVLLDIVPQASRRTAASIAKQALEVSAESEARRLLRAIARAPGYAGQFRRRSASF